MTNSEEHDEESRIVSQIGITPFDDSEIQGLRRLLATTDVVENRKQSSQHKQLYKALGGFVRVALDLRYVAIIVVVAVWIGGQPIIDRAAAYLGELTK